MDNKWTVKVSGKNSPLIELSTILLTMKFKCKNSGPRVSAKSGNIVEGGRRQNSLDYYDAFSYPSLVVILKCSKEF